MMKMTTKMQHDSRNPSRIIIIAVVSLFSLNVLASEPIVPIPKEVEFDMAKAKLGYRLFHDKILSKDQSISCASCHNLKTFGVDNKMLSVGISNRVGTRNSPSVFNSRFNFRQFWDGRSENLEDQAGEPIHNPKEMGSDWKTVTTRLSEDDLYKSTFVKLYPDGINPKNIKNAIAEFEKSLITPSSRFDQYLNGNNDALSKGEKQGYADFKNYGCISCHQGVAVGGNMFQKLGVFGAVDTTLRDKLVKDFGRELVTRNIDDRYFFKVPSLRNVAKTAPYFHDGSVAKLEDAVKIMGQIQLGVNLSVETIQSIVSFLKTLTGKPQGVLIEQN